MSYYQKSSYRPSGDSYRPGNRSSNSGSGESGQGSNDRSSSYRPHQSNNRPSNGSSYVPGSRQPSRYQGQDSYGANTQAPRQNYGQYQQNRYPRQGGNYGNNSSKYPAKGPSSSYHSVYSQTQADTQLWMGDLDPRWTESDISSIWASVGDTPSGVKIMRDKSGKPQYCFVTFTDSNAVKDALKRNKMPIPGSSRSFKLNWASGSSQSQTDVRQGTGLPRGNGPSKTTPDFSIFVGDLAPDATEPVIFARFDKEYPGSVKQVKIMVDANSGASKGFGFVRFHNIEAQQAALREMNGVIISKRPIRVGPANGGSSDTVSTRKEAAVPTVKLAQAQPSLTPFTDPKNSVISLKGLSSSVTRDEILAHFLPFGHIIFCTVESNMAFIKYLHRESAKKALIFMDGFMINGCRVALRWSRDEPDAGGKVRFKPGKKNAKYVAAEEPPQYVGDLLEDIVFEDLTVAEVKGMETIDPRVDLPISKIDQNHIQVLQSREDYLSSAY